MLTTVSTIASHEADILRRVVDLQRAGWTHETTEAILALALQKRDASRVITLARKACAGSLSPAEACEEVRHGDRCQILERIGGSSSSVMVRCYERLRALSSASAP
jgi:hypothetical protein